MGYSIGQDVTVFCRFWRERTPLDPPDAPARVPYDPDTVTLIVEDPSGEETDRSALIAHPPDPETGASEGYYSAIIRADLPGRWRYRFDGDGAPDEGSFTVDRSFVNALNGG